MMSLSGGALAAFILASVALAVCVGLAIYIYFSFAWMVIGNKMKYKNSWLAWIPFARSAMILELGSFNWALVFLYLVPVLGWIAIFILLIISKWRIFEKRKYPGWLSLLILAPQVGPLAHAIVLGFVAWKDNK
jgi:hypothetical protein